MDKLECLLRTDTSRSAVWIGEDTIAYLRKGDGGPRVWELDLRTGERRQRTFGDERIWSIEGHHQSGSVVFCMDEGGNEHEQIYLLGRDGDAFLSLFELADFIDQNIHSLLSAVNPNSVLRVYEN